MPFQPVNSVSARTLLQRNRYSVTRENYVRPRCARAKGATLHSLTAPVMPAT